jgi:hypothetical protein
MPERAPNGKFTGKRATNGPELASTPPANDITQPANADPPAASEQQMIEAAWRNASWVARMAASEGGS